MGFREEYLKERYAKMSIPQLEMVIRQINEELEEHPEADEEELCIAVEALEAKKKALKKNKPCLPSRFEHQIDVGEEF